MWGVRENGEASDASSSYPLAENGIIAKHNTESRHYD